MPTASRIRTSSPYSKVGITHNQQEQFSPMSTTGWRLTGSPPVPNCVSDHILITAYILVASVMYVRVRSFRTMKLINSNLYVILD